VNQQLISTPKLTHPVCCESVLQMEQEQQRMDPLLAVHQTLQQVL
jgi:hypothetical protein